MLALIECSIIGVVCGVFCLFFNFPFSEQSSLAMTRYNSFWSSKLELNQYVFTATEEVIIICYLLAQECNWPSSIHFSIFLSRLCFKIFSIFELLVQYCHFANYCYLVRCFFRDLAWQVEPNQKGK